MSFPKTGAAYTASDDDEDDTPGVHEPSEQRGQTSFQRQQAASKSHESLYSEVNPKSIGQDAGFSPTPACQLHLSKYTCLLKIPSLNVTCVRVLQTEGQAGNILAPDPAET